MSIKKSLLFGTFIIIITLSSVADIITPSSYCSKPYKPYQFNSQSEIDNFNYDVEVYKQCISDFVEEQNQAAERHQQAASNAIDEWNNFVNYELN